MGEPIHVAQVLNRMDSGGIEAVVMNYYRNVDRAKIQFDFYFAEDSTLPQKAELEKLGAGIYPVPSYARPIAYYKALYAVFCQRGYKIVHAHLSTMSIFPLFAAWRAKVPVRICHNHSTAHWGEGKKTLLKYILRPFARVFATDYFACGEQAGRWMYGNRCFEKGKVYVMPNAIDTKRFEYDPEARIRLRMELGIPQDAFVVGHVVYLCEKPSVFIGDFCGVTETKKQCPFVAGGRRRVGTRAAPKGTEPENRKSSGFHRGSHRRGQTVFGHGCVLFAQLLRGPARGVGRGPSQWAALCGVGTSYQRIAAGRSVLLPAAGRVRTVDPCPFREETWASGRAA